MTTDADSPCIEEIEPIYWNAGVTAHILPTGEVVVELRDSDPMPLTPHPFIPTI